MDNYTLYQLLLCLILFGLGVAAFVYIIILARNLNKSIKSINKLIDSNSENIDKALKDLPAITRNVNEITSLAKNEVDSIHNAISNLSETFQMTAASIKTFNHDILGNVRNIIHLIRLVKTVFFKKKTK